MATTALDIVTMALRDIGVLNASDPASGDDAAFGLAKLNLVVDNFNAEREAIYAEELNAYIITPGLGTHSIGPGGTWTAVSRPVRVIAASLADAVMLPTWTERLRMRELSWWQDVYNPSLTAEDPTDFAYLPEWPLGLCVLYPTPTVANAIVLQTQVLLAAFALTTTFSMPPGYQDAVTLTLEEMLLPAFRVPGPAGLPAAAGKARARIQANNSAVPGIVTTDYGMPCGGRSGSKLDWRTRDIV
jgi:hypothetical protein